MTNGLAILGGYTILAAVLTFLVVFLLRPNPCDESDEGSRRDGDRRRAPGLPTIDE